ncbi:MAG: serine hydrolase [Sphingobacteriales bacterium]|nr:serine hydrolase [Sphingobacteriales bacterium]MBI3719777.1 serine hydrolase [Sphingobacteriales bacterium]
MALRKNLKRIGLTVLLLVLIAVVIIARKVFPAVSGYGAKNMASAIYLQHRNPNDVIKEDLADFPKSLGRYEFNQQDSSVTASVWGFAKRKAIYRSGLGATLINDFTEEQVRAQQFNLPSKPSINSDTILWPYGDKIVDTIPDNVNRTGLERAIDHVFEEKKNGESVYTRAVIACYDGNIIAERYAPGFDKNSVQLGWSMSKSLTAAIIGILVKEGKLNVNVPAPVPEWKGNEKEKISLLNLLQQTSGLDFAEIYTRPSEVTTMLFSKGDMAAYTASRPLKYAPGTQFNYSSGNSNILSRIIRHTVGEKDYAAFPHTALFHKINAYSFLLEPDASGTYIGSSYSYATARDFVRFGLLYYNNGKWNGEQILPDNWVKESVVPPASNSFKNYGYQFWLNGQNEKDITKKAFPDVPDDMFYMDGYGGQDVYIIPSKKLVVLRLGVSTINENKFLKEVMGAIQ